MPPSDPHTIIPPGPNCTPRHKPRVQLGRAARGRVGTLVDRAGTAALREGQVAADVARVQATRQRGRAAPGGPGAAGAPLGITAGFVSTAAPPSEAEAGGGGNNTAAAPDAAAERRRAGAPRRTLRRYELQDTARALLPGHRIGNCQVTPTGGMVAINHHPEFGSASYGGLQTCGSMWACPVCAAKIGARRAEEVGAGAASWRARGGHIYMLTLTLRHNAGQALHALHAHMNAAYRKVGQGSRWKLAVARWGIIGRITAREHTHGSNGWHPHLHVLIFSTDDLSAKLGEVESWFNRRWRDELAKLGEEASEERGTHLREADDGAEDYIAKLASAWSVPGEVAGGQYKEARAGNSTPVQLLDRAGHGDELAGALYAEYVEATAGTSWLQWTPGLRALVGLVEELSDEEIAAEEREDATPLVVLTAPQWKAVCGHKLRGQLLAEACHGDGEYLAGWLLLRSIEIEPWQLEHSFKGVRTKGTSP